MTIQSLAAILFIVAVTFISLYLNDTLGDKLNEGKEIKTKDVMVMFLLLYIILYGFCLILAHVVCNPEFYPLLN